VEALAVLEQQARQAVDQVKDLKALDEVRVQYLGKKGLLTEQLKQLGKLPADQRPQAGIQYVLQDQCLANSRRQLVDDG